ncbi:WYL domain-containing protein [Curtobacterium sp. VKM Ac-2865]|uniref:helix-turn-helix transcriptional regulator n=1 Tax=Curtobacterium sp. VKM Ac-2865 TaxID=2783817 RepID=UPI001889F7D5|nr:WYL domain-containing protein [Curtobacterium sp. VKM Ac-2865]MBF4582212.1 WYL domain-containing protein [Curtobacterium sp. VKM Ac-2865]
MSGPSSRMLALLSLLQVRRDWPGGVLAERLDVSPRTVRRDVDRLRELGYRVEALKGPAGGYRLSAGSELPPLLFDDEQAVAIALALAVAPASGADIAESAVRALAAVRQVMPARLRHRIDAVEVISTPGATTVDPEVLVAVSDAVRTHQVLRFDHGADDQQDRPPRRVEPLAVVARNGRWYLLAWDPDAADWRTYRLDRMHLEVPTGRHFRPRPIPGGDPATFVAARFKGSDVVDAWPCTGSVVLHVPARQVAPYLEPDADLEDLGTDRCRITLGSWSWTALAAKVAGFDAVFDVLGPPELRDATRTLADRLSAASEAVIKLP